MNRYKLSNSHKRLLKFLLAGGTAAFVEYVLFILLAITVNSLFINNSISFMAGLLVSFSLNRTWVFGSKSNVRRQFALYVCLAVTNLFISNLLILLLVDTLSVIPMYAKIITMLMIAAWNYLFFSKIIFKNKTKE